VEPDLALVKFKKLVGGGMIKIVNSTVPSALFKLGYNEAEVNAIVSYIDATGTIEGAPGIKPEHLAVFDCSFKPAKGTRSIHYMGHVKMMAATQPFLSGAISKTVNLPQDCSVEDIAEAYLEAWRQGIKAVAIYRDNSKGTQPLNVTAQTDDKKGTRAVATADVAAAPASTGISPEAAQALAAAAAASATAVAQQQIAALEAQMRAINEASTQNADALDAQAPPRAVRHRLPGERASVTHKFGLGGHEGYITVGLYPNGSPGEIFIRMAKEGSTVSGLMDSFATAVSISLQHGVPLRVLCEKFAHTRFEPSGWTGNPEIGYAKSIMDYIFRWIQMRFLSGQQLDLFAGLTPAASVPVEGTVTEPGGTVNLAPSAAPEAVIPGSTATEAPGQPAFASELAPTMAGDLLPQAPAMRDPRHTVPAALASLADTSPQTILQREARGHAPVALSDQDIFNNGGGSQFSSPYDRARAMQENAHDQFEGRTPPQRGIAPEPTPAAAGNRGQQITDNMVNRDLYGSRGGASVHPSDRMKEMYEMGDSPSCATCGAIMTRSGSCYRCMSCGSTSGCS
jgi:ribonucleoside-diphosphate reductase alpha chain